MFVNVNCIHCERPGIVCRHPERERKGWLRILGKHPGCHMGWPDAECALQKEYPRPTHPPCERGHVRPRPPLRIVIRVE